MTVSKGTAYDTPDVPKRSYHLLKETSRGSSNRAFLEREIIAKLLF
jgi:hypothetical protein